MLLLWVPAEFNFFFSKRESTGKIFLKVIPTSLEAPALSQVNNLFTNLWCNCHKQVICMVPVVVDTFKESLFLVCETSFLESVLEKSYCCRLVIVQSPSQ